MDAAEMYDKMAADYADIAKKKSAYINSVNKIIFKNAPRVKRYLDIGGGDGLRTKWISHILNIPHVDLIDVSPEMIKKAERHGFNKTECVDFNDYCDMVDCPSYELVTALWNVLGHIEERDEALLNIHDILDKNNGLCFIDVNNRYNLAYGIWNVIKNIIFRRSGNHTFKFKGEEYPTYLFSPPEIKRLLKKAGLEIVKKYGVNYETGKVSKSLFRGQMVFIVRRAR